LSPGKMYKKKIVAQAAPPFQQTEEITLLMQPMIP